MVVQYIERKLVEKSMYHRAALNRLEIGSETETLSERVAILEVTPQGRCMNTIIRNIDTNPEDFIFYFDRLAALLIEQYVERHSPPPPIPHLFPTNTCDPGASTAYASKRRPSRRRRGTRTRASWPRATSAPWPFSGAEPRSRRR